MAAATSPEFAPLVSILTREQAVYQNLLELARQERKAIVEGKLPDLKAVLQRKQDILERLSGLEDRRIAWLQRYARKHDVDLDTVTLGEIVAQAGPAERQVLNRLHAGLRRRIDRLVELDRVTKTLLDGILQSIDVSLRFLLADDGSGAMYGAQGQLQATPVISRQLLECQA